MSNFKPNFIREYFEDVVKDYERSFIGACASAIFEKIDLEQFDLYFAVAKFQNTLGFTLTQCNFEKQLNTGGDLDYEKVPTRPVSVNDAIIPEFVKVTQLYEIYKSLTEVNLKNQVMLKQENPTLTTE